MAPPLGHWLYETEKFVSNKDLQPVMYCGHLSERSALQDKIRWDKGKRTGENPIHAHGHQIFAGWAWPMGVNRQKLAYMFFSLEQGSWTVSPSVMPMATWFLLNWHRGNERNETFIFFLKISVVFQRQCAVAYPCKCLRNDLIRSKWYNLVIVSYDVLRNDSPFFSSLSWNYVVLDEGHIIKVCNALRVPG